MSIWAPPKLHVLTVPGFSDERERNVAELSEQTDVCLHADPERKGVLSNWKTALECASSERFDSDWHFIVQDDVKPHKGWQQHLERACYFSPAPILGLTWCGKRLDVGARKRVPYMRGKYIVRGPAVAYRSDILPHLTEFATLADEDGYQHDDIAAGAWLTFGYGAKPVVTSYSIFEYLNMKSMIGHPGIAAGTKSIEDMEGVNWADIPSTVNLSVDNSREDEPYLKALVERWREQA